MYARRIKTMIKLAVALVAVATMGLVVGCDREELDVQAQADEPVQGDEATLMQRAGIYSMRVDDGSVDVDSESRVELRVLPGDDLKVNLDYPWAIEFDETDGVSLGATRLRIGDLDLDEERAIIPVDVTATEAGRHTLTGKADFSVCNDDICEILRGEPVEIVVEAREASPE